MGYEFHFEVFGTYWTWIAKGLGLTLYISIVAMIFALIIGLVVALLRISNAIAVNTSGCVTAALSVSAVALRSLKAGCAGTAWASSSLQPLSRMFGI